MTTFSRIYLDANIMIMLGEDGGESGELLRQIALAHSSERRPLFLTSQITLSEILVKPYRDGISNLAQFYLQTLMGASWLETWPITLSVLEKAAVLRSAYKPMKLPDAIHVAAAIDSNCSHLLTNDFGISDLSEIQHPFRDERFSGVSVIRPDIETLSTILNELAP